MPRKKSMFDRFLDEEMQSPSFAAEYERVGTEIDAVDSLIRAVDAARLDLGMTKADLARKVSSSPEAIRRLLTSGDANPTFRTVLEVLGAVGLRLSVAKPAPATSAPKGVRHAAVGARVAAASPKRRSSAPPPRVRSA